MLIRHISIPRHSHLVPLVQPKAGLEIEETTEYASYFTKTLNPEQPFSNILTSEKEGRLNQSSKDINDHSFSRESHEKHLLRESPQRIDEISAEMFFSPKKQNYKYQSSQIDNPEHNHKAFQLKSRFPTSSTYKPELSNNVYLSHHNNSQQQPSINQNLENFCYLEGGQDQSQEIIKNQHFNRINKNRQVYLTLERFKSKNKAGDSEEFKTKLRKKYSFEPPKQNISYPQPEINEPLQRQPEKKQTRLQPISKSAKPHISSPVLPEKNKKLMPNEQDEGQNHGIIFQKQKRKAVSLRKTSEQEPAPVFTPKSQIHLSNKKLKDRSPTKKSAETLSSSKIEISYRTSLPKLREICNLPSLERYSIIMKIPEIFAYPLFSGNQAQEELFAKADEALKHLQITRKDISLKKYSNCVVILSGSMGIVWHYSGKVYFGGWKHQILDEGAKQGLGLEWVPKKYVYYGEFQRNKREGTGIMKTSDNQLLAGLWRDNHFLRSLNFNADDSMQLRQTYLQSNR